jgi:hypothetical protein
VSAGDDDGASADLGSAVKLDPSVATRPDYPEALYARAVRRLDGEANAALADYLKAIEMRPTLAEKMTFERTCAGNQDPAVAYRRLTRLDSEAKTKGRDFAGVLAGARDRYYESLIKNGADQEQAGSWDQSISTYESAARVKSTDDVRARLGAVKERRAQALYERACGLMAAQDLNRARDVFGMIPDHKDAKAKLAEIDAKLAAEAAERDKREAPWKNARSIELADLKPIVKLFEMKDDDVKKQFVETALTGKTELQKKTFLESSEGKTELEAFVKKHDEEVKAVSATRLLLIWNGVDEYDVKRKAFPRRLQLVGEWGSADYLTGVNFRGAFRTDFLMDGNRMHSPASCAEVKCDEKLAAEIEPKRARLRLQLSFNVEQYVPQDKLSREAAKIWGPKRKAKASQVKLRLIDPADGNRSLIEQDLTVELDTD